MEWDRTQQKQKAKLHCYEIGKMRFFSIVVIFVFPLQNEALQTVPNIRNAVLTESYI